MQDLDGCHIIGKAYWYIGGLVIKQCCFLKLDIKAAKSRELRDTRRSIPYNLS
jgi:hypothetical protein